MNSVESLFISCPYCGETIEILIDCSVHRQEYIEDCSVCCRPITLRVACDAGDVSAEARRDDEC
ncbi:MAG: CPXCG motif-containing cysteine-rich protein [Pseudomonadota bacterium]